ncbi:MAG: tyrosine-type recombinase/integrase [Deltaproteobacteria bacterium]|nr:tyrosine-type recombinase/integrase [Deltaproteobacteria bacterium]
MSVFQKNGKWWIDYYDHQGKRRRKRVGPDKRTATAVLRDIQARIAKGEFLGLVEERITFKELAERYLTTHVASSLSPTTRTRHEGIIHTHLIPRFGDKRLAAIMPRDIEEYRAERAARVAPATVNNEFNRLRHMFGMAVRWSYVKANPCKGVKELKEPPGRIRYLTAEEYEQLLRALDPDTLRENPYNAGRELSPLLNIYLRPIVLVALHSGLRRSEILSLRRQNIDWQNRRMFVEHTKNGERRVIPMNDTLYETLRRLPARLDSEMLFPDVKLGMVTAAFRRAVKRAQLPDFHFHDLRHCFASYLTMGGANLRAVQMLLGHKDVRMTIRYSHLSPEHLQGAVKVLDGVFSSAPDKKKQLA